MCKTANKTKKCCSCVINSDPRHQREVNISSSVIVRFMLFEFGDGKI